MQLITKLDQSTSGDSDTTDLAGWVVVKGSPTMKTWGAHTNNDGSMLSGIWEATPGTYHTTYSAYEFVHMISEKIIITPDGGTPVTVKSGDAFVVENNFKGTIRNRRISTEAL